LRTVGIVAGLGPLAGAHFYKRLVELSSASSDQDHLRVVLISEPAIPSRIQHLAGSGESPVPQLREVIRQLVAVGAELIVIPSTTTNIYLPELAPVSDVPILPMIAEVTRDIAARGLKRIGILATTPTCTYEIYEEHFRQAGMEAVYPDTVSQAEVMRIIGAVKTGGSDLAVLRAQIGEIACRPWQKDVDGLLLACTEIPVIFPIDTDIRMRANSGAIDQATAPHILSSTDILARAVIREAQ